MSELQFLVAWIWYAHKTYIKYLAKLIELNNWAKYCQIKAKIKADQSYSAYIEIIKQKTAP